jgi:hypothetical protein
MQICRRDLKDWNRPTSPVAKINLLTTHTRYDRRTCDERSFTNCRIQDRRSSAMYGSVSHPSMRSTVLEPLSSDVISSITGGTSATDMPALVGNLPPRPLCLKLQEDLSRSAHLLENERRQLPGTGADPGRSEKGSWRGQRRLSRSAGAQAMLLACHVDHRFSR